MRTLFLAAALLTTAAAQAPREQSPAPRELIEGIGAGNSDAALAQEIAAAAAHPLGTPENPIRVAGPDGERAYLARLRCTDGKPPSIGEAVPAGVGAYGSVLNAYPVECVVSPPGPARLSFDRYHEENPERAAPAGFTLGS